VPLVRLINEWWLACISSDDEAITRTAGEFESAALIFAPEIDAFYKAREADMNWFAARAAWRYGGKPEGQDPQRPSWPLIVPESVELSNILVKIEILSSTASSVNLRRDADYVRARFINFILELDKLEKLLNAPESKYINRKDLADLLGLSEKTLKNKSKELPKPIGTTKHNVPVYDHQEIVQAITHIYPEKAFLLRAPPGFDKQH